MLCVRHGIMVVGPTGGGKSCNIRMLGTALTKLKQKEVEGDKFEVVKIHHLNPKSVRMGELYGEFDSNTVRYQSTASDACDRYFVSLILLNLFYHLPLIHMRYNFCIIVVIIIILFLLLCMQFTA